MRTQFLVTAHRDPAAVWRLCDRLLKAPDSSVLVRWDSAYQLPALPAGLDVELRPTREWCGWGTGAQFDAELDSLQVLESAPFDWLVVLSGQCYPIRPLHELAEFLSSTHYRMFFQTQDTVTPPASTRSMTHLQERYFFRYRWIPQRYWVRLGSEAQRVIGAGLQRTVQLLARRGAVRVQRRPAGFSPGIGVRSRKFPFTAGRPCRKGSDWFAMSRPVFDDLLRRIAAEPDVVDYFRRTFIPSESFFHTMLLPAWEGDNAGRNLHYLRFVGNSAHPEILDESDWDEFVASGEYFARKFDAASTNVLDRIDRQLL